VGKKEWKEIRDRVVPLLVERAHLEMMRLYKPGMVEPVGEEATVGLLMSESPIRTILGAFGSLDFYAKYDIVIPLRPLVPISSDGHEILQDDVESKVRLASPDAEELPKKGGETLLIYWTTYYVTKEGQVWHEDDENLWRPVMQLPEGLLQSALINLRATIHPKYHI